VGILSARRERREAKAAARSAEAAVYTGGSPRAMPGHKDYFQYGSPWSTSHLEQIAFRETFGNIPITNRAAAMAIPGVQRARTLLTTQVAARPLVLIDPQVFTRDPLTGAKIFTPVADQPAWITQCGDGSSPYQRALWSCDDLIFYGATCWWSEDMTDDDAPRSHVNYEDWEINTDTRSIMVNGEDVPAKKAILIPGPHEGVLTFGRTALQSMTNLYRIVDERIEFPQAETELHDTEGALSDTEKDELLKAARESRTVKGGASFFYTSKRIESKTNQGTKDDALLIDARNAAVVDGARMIGIHAGLLDATAPKASLDYSTQEGRGLEFYDFDLDPWIRSMTSRLSMDDVAAPGLTVVADNGANVGPIVSPTGPEFQD